MTIVEALICSAVGILIGLIVWQGIHPQSEPVTVTPEAPCIYYRNTPLENVPARCIRDGSFVAE